MIEIRMARSYGNRGRGRPPRLFAITDAGRSAFEHAYDDLATSALRFLAERAGPGAVADFARRQIAELEQRYRPAVQAAPPAQRAKALADALSADGYAASTSGAPAAAAASNCASITARSRTWPRSSAALRGGDGSIRPPARHARAAPRDDFPR